MRDRGDARDVPEGGAGLLDPEGLGRSRRCEETHAQGGGDRDRDEHVLHAHGLDLSPAAGPVSMVQILVFD